MAVDFTRAVTNNMPASLDQHSMSLTNYAGNIPSSSEVEGIEIRMLQPLIKNNKTLKIWPFPGKARLYSLTMVISDISNQLVGMMDLNTFSGVGDNEYLPINKTIYYWQSTNAESKAPNQVHVMSAIIKSKEQLREVGTILSKVKEDTGYKGLMDQLSSIVADAVPFSSVTNIAMQLAGIVGQYLGKVEDSPLGTVVNSFTCLHGDWDRVGVSPIRMNTPNVDFDFELIVRDSKRELQTENSTAPAIPGNHPPSYQMMPM